VLAELRRLKEDSMAFRATLAEQQHGDRENRRQLEQLITELRIVVSQQQIRSGLWGMMAGIAPALAVALYFLLRS
jgi:hypothetical protein